MLKNPKVRMAVVGVLILVVGYMFVLPRLSPSEAVEPEIPEHHNPGPTFTIASQVYNLRTADPLQPRYLKLGTVFEFEPEDPGFYLLSGAALEAALEEFHHHLAPKGPIIQDILTSTVSTKTLEEMATAVGREELKNEVMEAVRAAVGEPHLVNVYFTELVFQ